MKMNNINHVTDVVQKAVGDEYGKCILILISCGDKVGEYLPDVGVAALSVARAYWLSGGLSESDLIAARENCWRYLDENPNLEASSDKAFYSIRALICLLYPSAPSDDTRELIEFYFRMVIPIYEDFGSFEAEVLKKLQQVGLI
jgi:hypothetical protein